VRHVLWIGGPPASGKTTIATRLARRYGLRLYSADTRTWAHRDRALVAGIPAARQWEALTPTERWQQSTPDTMFAMSLHRERGPMVIDDLRALPVSPLIVAEGSPLPASAVSSGVAARSQAVWLLPTPEFQSSRLAMAETPEGQAMLYRRLREAIVDEAREHDVPALPVDGSRNISDMVTAVEQMFGAALQQGPRARSAAQRRPLLREINDAIIEQVRGYHARPWASGDPNRVRRIFVCECGDPACEADVERSVRDVCADRALAAGHVPPTRTRMNE